MATLSESIELNDNFTPVLAQINTAMTTTVHRFKQMKIAMAEVTEVSGFKQMKVAMAEVTEVSSFEQTSQSIIDIGTEIGKVKDEQEEFDKKIQNTNQSAKGLLGTLAGLVNGDNIIKATKQFVQASDQYSESMTKLNRINDGSQTIEQLNNKIFESAQRARVDYQDMLDIVGELGTTASNAFNSNDEMVAFSELSSKSFKIGGASPEEQESSMSHLTQAMSTGTLQGDAFSSIQDNAPLLTQAIAAEMDVSTEKLKELSSQGLITADVIKSALFNSASDITTQFESVPMKFSDITTSIGDQINNGLQPAFSSFSELLNSPAGQQFFEGIGIGIMLATMVASQFIETLIFIASVFIDNWSMIAPIILGIVTALALLYGSTLLVNAVTLVSNGIKAVSAGLSTALAIAKGTATAATITETAAQWGLNAALLACPITWIVLAIVALVAVIYAVIAAINHFAGTSISATGVILGVFTTLIAAIGNIFISLWNLVVDIVVFLWNQWATFAEFFANVFTDPIGSIKRLFVGLYDNILGILEGMAGAIDTIFGTNIKESVSGWREDLQAWADENVEEAKIQIPRLDGDTIKIDHRFNYEDAYNTGYEMGESFDEEVGKFFDGFAIGDFELPPMDDPSIPDFDGANINRVESIGSIDDNVEVSNEDLETMRELAEMKAIQNFVTLSPSVSVSTGDIKNGKDYEDILNDITKTLQEEVNAGAKEVWNVG